MTFACRRKVGCRCSSSPAHDVEESAACYRELVEKQGRGDLLERLGKVSWMATGFTLIQQRAAQWRAFIDRAISIYSDLLQQDTDPEHVFRLLDCLRNRAVRFSADREFVEALADCDKAIEIATPLLATMRDTVEGDSSNHRGKSDDLKCR